MTIVEFVRARLDDDEAWARAASQRYLYADPDAPPVPEGGVRWTWVTGEDWEPVVPDPAIDAIVGDGYCNLATVETWSTSHRLADGTRIGERMMPRAYANEIVEMDASAAGHIARHDPARVLREVEAKRLIVDLHPYARLLSAPESCESCAAHPGPCMTLRLLALPYSDHPGYDLAWRPS